MLPPEVTKTSKVLVVMRNPKDVCTSYFHHEKLIPPHSLKQSYPFDEYAEYFMTGNVPYGDYWSYLKVNWKLLKMAVLILFSPNVFQDALSHCKKGSVKMIWFEDMKMDMKSVIKDIGDFIGFQVTDDQMDSLVNHMKIDNFKKNDAVNKKPIKGSVPDHVRENFNFIRKGVIGDGKGHFQSPEIEQAFDNWVRENNKDSSGNVIGYTNV